MVTGRRRTEYHVSKLGAIIRYLRIAVTLPLMGTYPSNVSLPGPQAHDAFLVLHRMSTHMSKHMSRHMSAHMFTHMLRMCQAPSESSRPDGQKEYRRIGACTLDLPSTMPVHVTAGKKETDALLVLHRVVHLHGPTPSRSFFSFPTADADGLRPT